jgi:Pyruvate/2-oxoacid:ferredoxin oxidoreductase delta subunit
MDANDKYVLLQERLDAFPTGAPASPFFDEILHILFTEEEADVALHMNFMGNTAEHIAERASLPVEDVRVHLERMADKAIIFTRKVKGKYVYGLLPPVPGLFEFPFMKGGGTPMHERLTILWDQYKHAAQADAFAGKPTPIMRVVPVNKALDAQKEVLPYDEVARLIDQAEYIALTECACRTSLKRCNRPTDVCLCLGYMGEFLVERGHARHATKEEAHDALERADKAGLVHCSNNSQEGAVVICNCCPCCCTVLRGRVEMNLKNTFAPSRYAARVKDEECIGCEICIDERCPNHAIALNEDGVAVVSEEDCIGCGLCVTGCPSEAIELVPRTQVIETLKDLKELSLKILQEKGKLESFLNLMK